MDGIKKPLIGKERITIDGSRYKIKKHGNGYATHKSKLGKKILSTGLIAAMLFAYSEGNNLFGKGKNKEKETYEIAQVLPPRNIEYNLEKNIDPNRGNQDYSENVKNIAKSFSLKENYNLEKKIETAQPFFMDGKFGYLQNGKFIPASNYSKWKEYQEEKKKNEVKEEKKDKKGISAGTIALIAGGVAALGTIIYFATKKKDEPLPPPPTERKEYYVNAECLDMTGLDGNNFVSKKTIDDAVLIYNGSALGDGVTKFTHRVPDNSTDYTISINFTGSVHDDVLCVRKPGSKSNLVQTLSSDARINLKDLSDASGNVNVELYKIPNWVNMGWVKEALRHGTAIYNHDVTVYIVNDEYSAEEWPAAKQNSIPYINKALPQISEATGTITAKLDENATSGHLKVRLGKGLNYINPGHGETVNNGIIQESVVYINAIPYEVYYYLEELYQAMGVRDDIERPPYPLDGRIADEISNDTDILNTFGKALMRINYFLDPNTKLSSSASTQTNIARVTNHRNTSNLAEFLREREENPNLNLKQNIGEKANVGVNLSGRNHYKSLSFNGDVALGKGNAFADIVLGGNFRAGFYQQLFGNGSVSVLHDSYSGKTSLAAGVKPSNETSVDFTVDDVLNPNNVPFTGRYNKVFDNEKAIGAMVSVDNLINPRNISIGTNVRVKDLSAFINHTHSMFGLDATSVGVTYQINKDIKMIANGTKINKLNSFDISLLAKSFSLAYGKDMAGNDSIRVNINYRF